MSDLETIVDASVLTTAVLIGTFVATTDLTIALGASIIAVGYGLTMFSYM